MNPQFRLTWHVKFCHLKSVLAAKPRELYLGLDFTLDTATTALQGATLLKDLMHPHLVADGRLFAGPKNRLISRQAP
jgi:hypothetical protein